MYCILNKSILAWLTVSTTSTSSKTYSTIIQISLLLSISPLLSNNNIKNLIDFLWKVFRKWLLSKIIGICLISLIYLINLIHCLIVKTCVSIWLIINNISRSVKGSSISAMALKWLLASLLLISWTFIL
jgi:hypothetical protein